MACAGGPDTINTNLVLALDAANKVSYPGTGTGWYDLNSTIQSGSLKNGPTFNGGNGGCIVFDGTDDYVNVLYNSILKNILTPVLVGSFKNPPSVSVLYTEASPPTVQRLLELSK